MRLMKHFPVYKYLRKQKGVAWTNLCATDDFWEIMEYSCELQWDTGKVSILNLYRKDAKKDVWGNQRLTLFLAQMKSSEESQEQRI